MRYCALVFLIACTDASEVPTTVAHINVTATCESGDCIEYGNPFTDSCGPMGSVAVTPTTRDIEVLTSYDAADITGYVQLQYTNASETVFSDQVLTGTENADVYSTYSYEQLYTLTATGDVTNINMSLLAAANDNTLQFKYSIDGLAVQEDHVIDAAKPVRLETDDPGLTDACCSVGDWRQGGLVVAIVLLGLRRRRSALHVDL